MRVTALVCLLGLAAGANILLDVGAENTWTSGNCFLGHSSGVVSGSATDVLTDGNISSSDGYWHSCSANGWARFALPYVSRVSSVSLFNRGDCCDGRINGAKAYLVDVDGDEHQCTGGFANNGLGAETVVQCDQSVKAVYVKVVSAPGQHFHFSEIRAEGVQDASFSNLLLDVGANNTWTSGNCFLGHSSGVVDGSATDVLTDGATDVLIDGQFEARYWHTCSANGWARFALAATSNVHSVEVTNRADCCDARITGATAYLIDMDGNEHQCTGTFTNNGKGAPTTVECPHTARASFIEIRSAPGQHFHVSEVKAYGAAISECKFMAADSQLALCNTGAGHNAGNSFVTMPNPANDEIVLRQSGSNTEYQLNPIVEDNKRYKMKLWVAYTPDYNGAMFEFHYRWWHQEGGGNTAEQPAHEHLDILDTQTVGGRQWVQYQYVIQTEDVSANGAFNWYVGYRPDNTAGARFITDITFEETTDPATEDATSFEEVRFAIETDKSAAEIQANLPVYTQAVASTLGLATSQCSLSVVAARRRLVEGNAGATILVTIADITVNTQTSILTAVTSPVFTTSVSTQMQTAGVTTSLVVDVTAVYTGSCSVTCSASANTGILRVTHDTNSQHTHHRCYAADAGAGDCMCACCDATVSNCDVESNYAF